jgi:predicted outer membrane repeat protein
MRYNILSYYARIWSYFLLMKNQIRVVGFLVVGILVLLGFGIEPSHAANLTASDGASLAAAVTTANANADHDSIELTADILLTSQLMITSPIEIHGNGHVISTASALSISYFRIIESGTLWLNHLKLTRGNGTSVALNLQGGNLLLDHVIVGGSPAEGFITTNGHGSGIRAYDGFLFITDSELSYNQGELMGGAIAAFTSTDELMDVVIVRTIINHNSAETGGGLFTRGHISTSIIDSEFRYNSAETGGGGIAMEGGATLLYSEAGISIVNSVLDSNSAAGGGALSVGRSNLKIINSQISNNQASNDGNLANGGGISVVYGSLYITNTSIFGNIADTSSSAGAHGGGVYADTGNTGNIVIEKTAITNNSISLGASSSLPSCCGAGVYLLTSGPATVQNSSFSGNTINSTASGSQSFGGAGLLISSNVATGGYIYNNTITNNSINGQSDSPNLRAAGLAIVGLYGSNRNFYFANNIVSNNNLIVGGVPSASNCGKLLTTGNFVSQGNNAVGADCTDFSASSNDIIGNVALGALANNGGFSSTHSISTTPPINSGNFSYCPVTDQRSALRDSQCDIGAYEASASVPTNNAPLASADSFETMRDSSLTANLLSNDSDANGDALTAHPYDFAEHGEYRLASNGTLTYTPDTSYEGSDSFSYILCDERGLCSTPVSVQINVTPAAIANAPSNLVATASSNTQIDLSWTDNSTNEASFKIETSSDGSTWTVLTTVSANTVSYSNTSLTCETAYYYRVMSTTVAGDSSPTNVANATTLLCPLATPTNLAATVAGTTINLTWTDTVTGETNFRLERSIDNGVTWTEIAQPAANATSYVDNTAACGISHNYRIRAYRASDFTYSPYSNNVTGTIGACTSPLVAPTNVTATAHRGYIHINWSDANTSETNFRVERSSDGLLWSIVGTGSTTASQTTDYATYCATNFHYRVRAYRSSDNSFSPYSSSSTPVQYDCATPLTVEICTFTPMTIDAAPVREPGFINLSTNGEIFYLREQESELFERGQRVFAFSANPWGAQELWEIRYPKEFAVSADGYRVSYIENDEVLIFENGFSTPIYSTNGLESLESLSMDSLGWRIAFVDTSTGGTNLVLYDVAMGLAQEIVQGTTINAVTISQDGSSIIFASKDNLTNEDPDGLGMLYRWDDVNGVQSIGRPDGVTELNAEFIRVDGNGSHIAFRQRYEFYRDEVVYEIYVWNAVEGFIGLLNPDMNLRRDTRFEYETTTLPIAWSFNGERLLFLAFQDLTGENPDTFETEYPEYFFWQNGFVRQVTTTIALEALPYGAGMSYDGSRIMVKTTTPFPTNAENDASAETGIALGECGMLEMSYIQDFTQLGSTSSSIELSWTDSLSGEDYYILERSDDFGASYTELGQVAAGSTSFNDTNLTCEALYQYRIRGYRASDDVYSYYSEVTASTGACYPAAPSALTLDYNTAMEFHLEWTDNANDETDFRLERSVDNGATWSEIAQAAADSTSYTDSSVSCDTSYDYRIRAYRSEDDSYSSYSNVVTGTTSLCPAPTAPTGLNIVSLGQTNISLGWTDNSNETGFLLERSVDNGATWSEIAQPPADSTSYTDSSVSCGTGYEYRIRAYRSGDNQYSDYSNVVTGTTSLCPTPTPPPVTANIKDISFENGNLTHAISGVDSVVGTVLLETSNPLKGLYSARIAPLGASPYLQESFSATNDFYLSFYIKIDSYPTTDLRLVLISNAGTTLGNLQLRPSGSLRLRNNSTTIGLESAPLALGQLYRIGIQQSKGTGSNAVLRAWLSPNDSAFGSPFAQLTNGTWTTAADRLRLGATTAGTFNLLLDDIRLDTTAMPAASNPPNAAPSISDVTDKSVSMNSSSSAIAFTVGDAETGAASLHVSASSSNTSLVPNANIVLGGSGANRTVTISPSSNQIGSATINLTVSDGTSNTSDAFVLTVTNTAPTISNLSDQSINANSSTSALAFSIGDAETAATSLVMTASSSNTSLVPVANIVFGGSGTNRTVTVTPSSNQAGTATITLTVSDGYTQSSDSFVLTVIAPPNTPPSISDVTDQSINANSSTSALAFTIGDAETAATSLVLTANSSNTALVPVANIVFGGSGTNRTVTISPASNQAGSATITLSVSDGYAQSSDTFVLTVTAPPNTPPTISDVTDTSISVNSSTGALGFTIGDAETAATNLVLSAASSNTALVPVENIVFGGSGTNRTVTISPASNQAGSATIGITVSDGFTSTMDTFILTVTNTAPTISNVTDQTINVNSSTSALAFTVADAETAASSLVLSASSSDTSLVPNANIVFGGSGASRSVTVTPASNQTGTATISLTVSDGFAQSSDSFVLTVNASTGTTVLNFAPSDDAYVRSDNVNSNYGSIDHIRLRGTAAFYNSYLKFNLSNINGTVTSARLRLYSYDGTNDPNSVYLVSNNYLSTSTPWTQLGLKWNNAPAMGNLITTRTASIANNTWVEYDVTSAITMNGTYSFGLSSSTGTNSLYFNSLEATSGRPVLEVTFTSGSNTAPTISDVSDQTITANSATAALPFTIGDVETPAANLQLSVSSSNTALVPNANLSLGGSGANRSITVTPVINQTGTTTITMTVSDGVLTASDSFVVNVTVGGGTTSLSFSPSDDAYVRSDNANSNYGSADHIRMRGTEAYYTSYLKFNLTGLTGTVTSARLRLYSYDGSNEGGSVYSVSNNYLGTSSPWLESGLKWNNAPQMSGSPVVTRPTAIANNTWVEYDLTPVITGNGTYSFGLSIVGSNSLYFYSDEAASNRPVLEITVNGGGTSSSSTLFTRPETTTDANVLLPIPTAVPTEIIAPTELVPSETPLVEIPTLEPTAIPTEEIVVPTELPTEVPTEAPAVPSEAPVEEATSSP